MTDLEAVPRVPTPNAELLVSAAIFRVLFDLPARMTVVGCVNDDQADTVRLLVHDATLPAVPPGALRHIVQPIFQRVRTGECVLQEIRVETSVERAERARVLAEPGGRERWMQAVNDHIRRGG